MSGLPLTPAGEADIRLGLIGDNIHASRSPALHRLAGALCGLRVSYDLLIPPALGLGFDAVLEAALDAGLAGVNVTLPYKERAAALVPPGSDAVARIGAINTVRFGPEGPRGHNTDRSGFVAAWRAAFGAAGPGAVALIGTGGVGRAVAFGLHELGARPIFLIDREPERAEALAAALAALGAQVATGGLDLLARADGIVNGTPLGMTGYPGSPVPEGTFPRAAWAFDAVYTPPETPFRAQALAAGARVLSGWELFFRQGIDAFAIFTGRRPDPGALRAALGDAPPLPAPFLPEATR